MHIKDALLRLKEGKKIRHSSWGKEEYICMNDKTNDITFYHLQAISFNMEPSILISNEWETLDGNRKNMDFMDALFVLSQGGKIRSDYIEGEFIEMDLLTKNIFVKKVIESEFIIDHQSLFSTEWIEVQ